MKLKYTFTLTAVLSALSLQSSLLAQTKKNAPTFEAELYKKIQMLSPKESIAKIQLPEGYALEPVLSEPNIAEPVACVFDGNGRMYVIEMNTYMQDADATDELTPKSRISMHEDTNGDGKYDKHSTFIDNLLLPRMVLPLEDGIVVGTTNTHDLSLYKDTDNDGVADQKSVYYTGGDRGGNLEHQPSGLIWSLDNWTYTTYNAKRYKMGPEKLIKVEPTAPNQGQWGLSQDNYGKPWFVNGGHETGPMNYQHPIVYGRSIHFKNQEAPDFRNVYPICDFPDVQGGARRLKPLTDSAHLDCGKVLNHFTSTCGSDIFRGDRLPEDLQGDLIFAEPTGRLIRRTSVKVIDGVTTLKNATPKSEFIRSTDPNFRPVNMVTAPDGTLYIVDMYRGIIQEGNWTSPRSYLRKVIDKYGFDKNIQHGRIYRLTHKDFKRGPKPNMIGAKSADLVNHLTHPNGWWRDTAQKILVLRKDASVKDALSSMAKSHENHLARIHALWTLEGMDALEPLHVNTALADQHPQVRRAAIRTSETLIKAKHPEAASLITAITAKITDKDPEVIMQTILTAELLKLPNLITLKTAAEEHSNSDGVMQTLAGLSPTKNSLYKLPKNIRAQYKRGKEIYIGLCSSCHGEDGKGTKAGDIIMAPPFDGSKTVNGHHAPFINIVLHGLTGPVEGKNYAAPMVAMKSQNDQWIADVTTYIKNNFNNNGGSITEKQVAELRQQNKDRATPWTIEELSKLYPQPLDTAQWKVSASHNNKEAKLATDSNQKTRYTTKAQQTAGMWYQVEFPKVVAISSVVIDSTKSPRDTPKSYLAEVSLDGTNWTTAHKADKVTTPKITIELPATKAKFFRITNTGKKKKIYWSIHELSIIAK